MNYLQACTKYKREVGDLGILKARLIAAPDSEHERIQKNIESKRTSIEMLEKWFRFTGNKIPKTP